MARSIVLRFDATCFDCGRSLSAGTTARWFGKGRVSCCGNPQTKPGDYSPAAVPSNPPRQTVPASPSSGSPAITDAERRESERNVPVPASPAFGDDALDAELSMAVRCGLSPAQLNRLAQVAPGQRLCVRLSSGARFVVSAQHAVHLLACITESCRDKIRDVMGASS